MSSDVFSERAMQGAEMQPLSKEQKKRLCMLAREVFLMLDNLGLVVEPGETTTERFALWRAAQQLEAIGKESLRSAYNKDYRPLVAHYLALQGKKVEAFRLHMSVKTEPREQAMWALQRACREVADVLPDALGYARGFLKNKRKVNMDDCSARDLKHAMFTVRRRAQQLRKRTANGRK